MFASAQETPPPRCAAQSASEIRAGVVGTDLWYYWWCRDETKVWITWQGFLEAEMKSYVMSGSVQRMISTDPFNMLGTWGPESDRPEMAHLKAAVITASAADPNRPVPGPAFPTPTKLPELWNVTPNGASPTRRTNLVQNGKPVAIYGTQTVKVLTPCDCSVVSYPEGSVTKKCPLAGKIVTEVVSCMRLR
jgi:hypothetical protein